MKLNAIYCKGYLEEKRNRLIELSNKHEQMFNCPCNFLFSTSGRTELGGNHTDHNLGHVLAGSIDLDTIAAVHENSDYTVTFISEGYSPVEVDLSNLNPVSEEREKCSSLIRGIAASIVSRGGYIGGFTANTSSTIYKGSGLSTSAAVEVLIGTIFNHLFNDDRFTTTELAIMGQEAENNYFGKPCGLMDQVACANGGVVEINFLDKKNPIITPVEVDFSKWGYDFVVVSTGGSHADLTSDYSAIPNEMKAVSKYFGKEALAMVNEEEFYSEIKQLRTTLSNDRAILRACHFFEENNRVPLMFKALKENNSSEYLRLVNESGNSSYKYLQNIYSPLNTKEQGISLALNLTEKFLKGEGACRIQGGGFAGTIQAFIPQDRTKAYCKEMENLFNQNCCTKLVIRNAPSCFVEL